MEEPSQPSSKGGQEISFPQLRSITLSIISSNVRYVAFTEWSRVFIWSLPRKKLVGEFKMSFNVTHFDFDNEETRFFVFEKLNCRIHEFVIEKDEKFSKGPVVDLEGYGNILQYSPRTNHILVTSAVSSQIVLLELNSLKPLHFFSNQCKFFNFDEEANSLLFRGPHESEIGLLNMASFETFLFRGNFESNVFNFLSRSRKEVFSCSFETVTIFDILSRFATRKIAIGQSLFETSCIVKSKSGFSWVSIEKGHPFRVLSYQSRTSQSLHFFEYKQTHLSGRQGNTRFTYGGFFSASFGNILRVAKLDLKNSSDFRVWELDGKNLMKVSGSKAFMKGSQTSKRNKAMLRSKFQDSLEPIKSLSIENSIFFEIFARKSRGRSKESRAESPPIYLPAGRNVV